MKTLRFWTRQTADVEYVIQVPDHAFVTEGDLAGDLSKYTDQAVDVDFISLDEEYVPGSLKFGDRKLPRKKPRATNQP